jgi:hypothetical protein
MRRGARTPEELETLLEDAVVLHDREAVSALFEEDAVIEGDLWDGRAYVADPRHVVQRGNTALVVGGRSINVVRRGSDGAWRYAISLLTTEGEDR